MRLSKKANMSDIYKMSGSKVKESEFKDLIYEYLNLSAKSMIKDNYAFSLSCIGYIQVFQFKAKKSNVYFVNNGERKIQMKGQPYFAFKWMKGSCRGAWKYFNFRSYPDKHKQEVGNRGLAKHIKHLDSDPYSKNYSAPPLSLK